MVPIATVFCFKLTTDSEAQGQLKMHIFIEVVVALDYIGLPGYPEHFPADRNNCPCH